MLIFLIIITASSFSLTFFYRYFALRLKILDIPNNRSSHSSPVPRGGGLAIIFCWYAVIVYLYVNNLLEKNLFFAFASGLILAVISLLDDLFSIKPIIRLLTQLVTATLAVYFINGITFIDISGWIISNDIILTPLLIFSIVWFINLYNFLDGIDGYASIEAISVALVIYLFTGNLLLLIFASCVAGFLFWNWPKAKIFMGDVGSTQLGYVLIIMGIYFNNKGEFDFMNWLLISSPFWFDATLTLFRRWRKGERIDQPHKKHAYQRLVQSGYSHLKVDLLLICLNFLIGLTILFIDRFKYLQLPISLIIIIFLYLLTRIIDRKVPF